MACSFTRGLILLVAFAAAGCSHTVKYKLDKSDRWSGPVQDKTLRVDTFVEKVTLPAAWEVRREGKNWRTNYRKRYKDQEIATDVSNMLAAHLAHSGLFRKVVRDASQPADLVLSGAIAQYSVTGTIDDTAESIRAVSAGMGLVGAIAGSISTAGAKTTVNAKVELNPVTLTDANGKLLWQSSVSKSTNFTAHFSQSSEGAIFHHPDRLLKDVVTELIQQVGSLTHTNVPTADATQAGLNE